eukprot:jgi/Mesvir1/14609/Mv05279-RA.1
MPPSCSRPPTCANRKGSCYELTTNELNDLLNEPGSKRKTDVARLTPQQRCAHIRKLGMHFDRRVDRDTCLRLKRVEDMVSGGQMNRWRQLSVLLNSAYPGKAGLKRIEEIENSPKEFAPMLKAVEQVFFGGKVPYRTVVEMTEEPDYPAYAYTIGSDSTLYINRPRMNQLIDQMHEYHEDGKKAALNDETSGKIKVLGGIPLNMFTPLTSVAGILAHEYIHVIQSNCRDTPDEREHGFHGPIFRHVANLFTGSSISDHSSAHTVVDRDIVYADKLPDDDRELVDRPDDDPSALNPTRELAGMKGAGYPARAIEDDSTAEYRARVAARRKIYKTIRTSQRMGDNLLQMFVEDAEVTFTSAYRKNQKYKFALHFMDKDPRRDMKRRIKINEEHGVITEVLDAIYARYPPVLKAVTKAKFEHAGDGDPPPFGSANDRPPGFEDVTPVPPSRPSRAKYARAPFGAMNEVASMRRGGVPETRVRRLFRGISPPGRGSRKDSERDAGKLEGGRQPSGRVRYGNRNRHDVERSSSARRVSLRHHLPRREETQEGNPRLAR